MYQLQPQLKTFESIMGKHAAAILQLRRQQRRTKVIHHIHPEKYRVDLSVSGLIDIAPFSPCVHVYKPAHFLSSSKN